MLRSRAIIGSAIFLVIAPGTLAVYIPWAATRWRLGPALLGFSWLRVIAVLFIAAGLPVLLDSFARFAIHGLGTPAPMAPPERLVVTGLYRYVRNPMYVAVLLLIFGQGLLFASAPLPSMESLSGRHSLPLCSSRPWTSVLGEPVTSGEWLAVAS